MSASGAPARFAEAETGVAAAAFFGHYLDGDADGGVSVGAAHHDAALDGVGTVGGGSTPVDSARLLGAHPEGRVRTLAVPAVEGLRCVAPHPWEASGVADPEEPPAVPFAGVEDERGEDGDGSSRTALEAASRRAAWLPRLPPPSR